MAIENRNLPIGTRLWANYKKTRYVCTVEAGEEEGAVAFVLEDASKHRSPSAAGSKVMGGKAVNGWRFWTVEGDEPATTEEEPKARGVRRKKQSKTFYKMPQEEGKSGTRYFCSACMKAFTIEGDEEPEACPEGHRNDDPELNAPAGITSKEEEGAA